MDSLSSKHPLIILKELEQIFSSRQPSALDLQSTIKSGLIVLIGQLECFIENQFIHEILLPDVLNNLSRVPGTKTWLKGLISLRGQAIPIVDLGAFLFKTACTISANTRILILDFGDFQSGILIDKSLGLKHFDAAKNNSISKIDARNNTNTTPYISEEMNIDNHTWPILDISRLGDSIEFRNMAGN